MAKKLDEKEFKRTLSEGLKYPWAKAGRLWNILWILLPIYGWFALMGYVKKIVRDLVNGKMAELPKFGSSWKNFKDGMIVFIFLIPTMIALGLLNIIPFAGTAAYFLASIFLLPWLVINFMVKETFDSLWELKNAFNNVFNNAVEYIFVYLKTLVFIIIYSILSFVLVGIPCYMFGYPYFLAGFYRRYH